MFLGRRGFTLVEILLVTVLIGILATLGFISYADTVEKSRAAEAYPVLAAIRDGYLLRLAENLCVNSSVPGCTWNPNATPASSPSWEDIGLGNPNANPNASFTYDFWDAGYSSGSAPVSAARYVAIALRKKSLIAYAWGSDVDFTKYIYMDLDTGRIYKSKPY